jgi:hypothetical protein
VPSPNLGAFANSLNGVAATADDDVWAVGLAFTNGENFRPLVEHWNGGAWTASKVPGPSHLSQLKAVDQASANDVWATGNYEDPNGFHPLFEHWDGTAWSRVAGQNTRTGDDYLDGIAALGPDDVWAVGHKFDPANGGKTRTLVEHWDGASWSIVPSPNWPGQHETSWLAAVAGTSSTDVWAVGFHRNNAGLVQPLIEHWDGARWSIAPAADGTGSGQNSLFGVATISASDAWAAGTRGDGVPLTEHWDGTAWRTVDAPGLGPFSALGDLAVRSSSDVWAVGGSVDLNGVNTTLLERWDGAAWSIVSTPNPGPAANSLLGIDAAPGGRLWAAGAYLNDFDEHGGTLIESACP